MAGEYSSGARLEVGSRIRGYEVRRVFDPGQFASAAEAVAADGRRVFLKKYKQPGMYSAWYDGFLDHQIALRTRIAGDAVARSLCDEFIECFSHEKIEPAGRKRALYVVYGMLEKARDLATHLASAPPVDERELRHRLTFGRVIVAAVAAVHRCGIVHADLKPENVMLIADPSIATGFRLRLIDFDFSLMHGRSAPWQRDIIVGTPGYLSPEHIRGEVPLPGSDVFTLGVMLVQLLTGRHPCADSMDRYDELAEAGRLAEFELPRALPESASPRSLTQALRACLHPDPAERPTARKLLDAMNGVGSVQRHAPASIFGEGAAHATSPGPLRIGAPDLPAEVIRSERLIDDRFIRTWYTDGGPASVNRAHFRVLRDPAGRWMIEPWVGAETRLDGQLLLESRVLESGRSFRITVVGGRDLVIEIETRDRSVADGILRG